MDKKLAIIFRMIEKGYHLMGRTAEEMASIFTVDDLETIESQQKYAAKERKENTENEDPGTKQAQ